MDRFISLRFYFETERCAKKKNEENSRLSNYAALSFRLRPSIAIVDVTISVDHSSIISCHILREGISHGDLGNNDVCDLRFSKATAQVRPKITSCEETLIH